MWQGSQLPLKFQFVSRQDIYSEVKGIEGHWKLLKERCEEMADRNKRVVANLGNIEQAQQKIEHWLRNCNNVLLNYEEHYLEKDLKGLKSLEAEHEVIQNKN